LSFVRHFKTQENHNIKPAEINHNIKSKGNDEISNFVKKYHLMKTDSENSVIRHLVQELQPFGRIPMLTKTSDIIIYEGTTKAIWGE